MSKILPIVTTYRFIHITGRCLKKNYIMRKPVRVLNVPTPVENVDTSIEGSMIKPKHSFITPTTFASLKKDPPLPAIIDKPEENVVSYQKLDKYDKQFTKTLALLKSRTKREKTGQMLLEGKRLINDAISAGLTMKALYFSREEDLKDIKIKNPEEVQVCKVLYRTLKVWSCLTTSPGVLAVFKRPTAEELSVTSQPTIPVTILCDNIREPGNLGSIIRNAAAAGCRNILLTKGCADPWEVKCLRAACGGHFRIPITNDIDWTQISNYIPSNATIFVADGSADIEEVSAGSDFIDFVADEEKDIEDIDEIKYITYDEDNKPIRVDESFSSKEELEKYREIQLPCHLYCSLKYPDKNIVLYIGGETHGVNPKIVKLACEYGGRKIKIPMENGVESVNSAFAMTVILYEIKRQLAQKYVTK